jgi:NifB/MoaA-like Fe-S oxidoreductase
MAAPLALDAHAALEALDSFAQLDAIEAVLVAPDMNDPRQLANVAGQLVEARGEVPIAVVGPTRGDFAI